VKTTIVEDFISNFAVWSAMDIRQMLCQGGICDSTGVVVFPLRPA